MGGSIIAVGFMFLSHRCSDPHSLHSQAWNWSGMWGEGQKVALCYSSLLPLWGCLQWPQAAPCRPVVPLAPQGCGPSSTARAGQEVGHVSPCPATLQKQQDFSSFVPSGWPPQGSIYYKKKSQVCNFYVSSPGSLCFASLWSWSLWFRIMVKCVVAMNCSRMSS